MNLSDILILLTPEMGLTWTETEGAQTIRNGTSIDVYRDTLEGCYEWAKMYGDYVYIQVVDAAG